MLLLAPYGRSAAIIIMIKVNYNYHENYPRILWGNSFSKLYNFPNSIRRRMSDHSNITFAIKYLPVLHLEWWHHQSRDFFRVKFWVAVTRFRYRVKNKWHICGFGWKFQTFLYTLWRLCEEDFRKIRSSRFRDIQKSVKVQILNDVALIQVVRTRVSFQDSKSENTPKFPSTKILY